MKKLFVSMLAIYSAFWMTACGKDGGGGTNVVQVPVCAAGTVWNGTSCVVGVAGSTTNTFRYRVQSYSRGDNAAIKSFLEYGLDVCRDKNSSGYYDCGNWAANALQVSIAGTYNTGGYCYSKGQVTPSSLTFNIAIQPPLNMYINYGTFWGVAPTYRYNGVNMTATGNHVTDCNTVRIVARYGLYDVTLDLENAKLTQNTVPFKLWWGFSSTSSDVPSINPPRIIGSGTLVRY